MYKYNKNDNMTKELVWSSGQYFPWFLERLGSNPVWLQFARPRFAMYCSLNSLDNCANDVIWPLGRLMNQSIIVPTRVLMNNLHCTASEPPTNIICVWKVVR